MAGYLRRRPARFHAKPIPLRVVASSYLQALASHRIARRGFCFDVGNHITQVDARSGSVVPSKRLRAPSELLADKAPPGSKYMARRFGSILGNRNPQPVTSYGRN